MITSVQPQLVTPTRRFRFAPTEDITAQQAEKSLQRVLQRHCDQTERISVTKASDLLLSNEALVQGQYKLTVTALNQLCSKLAPGLASAAQCIAGVRDRPSRPMGDPHVGLAIRWINDAVRLRFSAVEGMVLVLDHDTRTVEGLVGKMYAHFPNASLYALVNGFLLSHYGREIAFDEAILDGRRLLLRYKNHKPMFELTANSATGRKVREPFLAGFHFANSEVGECAIRAATVILRQVCDNKAISPFHEGGRIPHIQGPKFEKRLYRLFDQLKIKADQATKFKAQLLRLIDTKLGAGGDLDRHNVCVRKLVSRLVRRNLRADFAKRVVNRAMHFGSYASTQISRNRLPVSVYADRTAYDIFNALTHEAKKESPARREGAEQVAYQMLTGQFSII